jgi:hypothetical protein
VEADLSLVLCVGEYRACRAALAWWGALRPWKPRGDCRMSHSGSRLRTKCLPFFLQEMRTRDGLGMLFAAATARGIGMAGLTGQVFSEGAVGHWRVLS